MTEWEIKQVNNALANNRTIHTRQGKEAEAERWVATVQEMIKEKQTTKKAYACGWRSSLQSLLLRMEAS